MIATFVESGSLYENGCLSSATRLELLGNKINPQRFKTAKFEVLNDIVWNPDLKFIVEQIARPPFENRQLELLVEFKKLLAETLSVQNNARHLMFEEEMKSGSSTRNLLRLYASIVEWEKETDK